MKYKKILRVILIMSFLHGSSTLLAQAFIGGSAAYNFNLNVEQHIKLRSCQGEGGIIEISLNGDINKILFEGQFNEPGNSLNFRSNWIKNHTSTKLIFKAVESSSPIGKCHGVRGLSNSITLDYNKCFETKNLKLTFDKEKDYYTVNYESKPVIKINAPGTDDFLTSDDYLTINLPDHLNNDEYNWQYSITEPDGSGTTNFLSLPNQINGRQVNYVSTLKIKGSEFLDDNQFNKIINFRVKSNCASISSNTISLSYLRSAPHILKTSSDTISTSCFDAEDASIRLTFDSNFRADDKVNISIVDLTEPTPSVLKQLNNVTLTDLDETNSILIEGIPPCKNGSNARIELFANGVYTEGSRHKKDIIIQKPDYVTFDINEVEDVVCFGGNDGMVQFTATGGNGSYHYTLVDKVSKSVLIENNFAGHAESITSLSPGLYILKLEDLNGCKAREVVNVNGTIQLGQEIEKDIVINEPLQPLQIEFISDQIKDPSAYQFKNGKIKAHIFGGTPKPDGSYNFSWTDHLGNPLNSFRENIEIDAFGNQQYFVTLSAIGAGTFSIKATNIANDPSKEGCYAEKSITLTEPAPISIEVEAIKSITCHSLNSERNTDQNGQLKANVTGGVPLEPHQNRGYAYYYIWKKQLANGTWETLLPKEEGEPILDNLTAGIYSVNVEDANGISIGTYVNDILAEATDITYHLEGPQPIEINVDKSDLSCYQANDGRIKLAITGGNPPYDLQWSEGGNNTEISNLVAGEYTVYVQDTFGCVAEKTILISEPDELQILVVDLTKPTCNDSPDGKISIEAKGGVPPYTYEWDFGQTTESVEGLQKGTYTIKVRDQNRCEISKEVLLPSTFQPTLNLQKNRTLCKGQAATFDITIDDLGATYQWTSDTDFTSSSSKVTIDKPGNYQVKVTNTQGCSVTESIRISASDELVDAYFLVSSQAYTNQDVALVNVSEPIGDRTEWIIPQGIDILEKYDEMIILKFDKSGSYQLGIRSFQGDCYQEFIKNIVVEEKVLGPSEDKDEENKGYIEEISVYPNPNRGTFHLKVKMQKSMAVSVRIINLMTSGIEDSQKVMNTNEHTFDYSLKHLPSGIYLMSIETPKGTSIRKVVIE